jgi:hypothetical protein
VEDYYQSGFVLILRTYAAALSSAALPAVIALLLRLYLYAQGASGFFARRAKNETQAEGKVQPPRIDALAKWLAPRHSALVLCACSVFMLLCFRLPAFAAPRLH